MARKFRRRELVVQLRSSTARSSCVFLSRTFIDHRDLYSFPTRRSSDLAASSPAATGAGRRRRAAARRTAGPDGPRARSEEHTSELQSQSNLVCPLLLEKKDVSPSAREGGTAAECKRTRRRDRGQLLLGP